MSKSEINPQELMIEYEMIRQEIGAIDQQIRQLQEHHASLLGAKESIDSLKEIKSTELLVPGGAGVYFKSTVQDNNACLVNVGAGIIIEMPFPKAQKTMSDRIDQALSMIVKLNEEADGMVVRLRQIESIVQAGQ